MSAWLLAATLCLTQLSPAWGQSTPPAPDLDEDDTARTEPQPEQEDEPQGEVVIVLGERQSKEALEAMDKQLRDLGYDTVRRRNGRTIYLDGQPLTSDNTADTLDWNANQLSIGCTPHFKGTGPSQKQDLA